MSKQVMRLGRPLGLLAAVLVLPGCLTDPDCGICDPNHLVLESLGAPNYAGERVYRLTDGVAVSQVFGDRIEDCLETPEALDAAGGADEYCKLSPLMTHAGLDLVFNNLLDPTSVERVRRDPADPTRFEVYDWKAQIARIEGPITRFNGSYDEGRDFSEVERAINLTCIDNLRAQGIDFDAAVLEADPDICEGFWDGPDGKLPLRTQADGVTRSYKGDSDWRVHGCAGDFLAENADACCDACEYALSIEVAKYGLDAAGQRRSFDTAIPCEPGRELIDCREFVPSVDRSQDPLRYTVHMGGR